MFSRACSAILGHASRLPTVQGFRGLTVVELETKGKYTLKVNVEPFKKNEVKFEIKDDHIRITGERILEKTGKSDFTHVLDTSVSLPHTLKKDTIKARYDQGFVVVEADSSVQ